MTEFPEKIHVIDSLRGEARIEGFHVSEPRVRESMRGRIAVGLLGVLVLEIVYASAAIPLQWMTFDQAKEFLSFVTAPTVGLVGPVIGFYFSSQK